MILNFKVTKLNCEQCVKTVKAILIAQFRQISDIQIDLQTGIMIITSQSYLDPEAVIKAIESQSNWHVQFVETLPENSYLLRLKKYRPLAFFFSIAILLSLLLSLLRSEWSVHSWMNNFMASFFLVFGILKLINIRGFAKSFREYDPVSRLMPVYGYLYPFIELVLGFAYLSHENATYIHIVVIVTLGLQTIGILKRLTKGAQPQCACLGGFFAIPISGVTVVENGIMITMAALML